MKKNHMITDCSKMNIEFKPSNDASLYVAFPSMSNAVSQKENKEFGQHLIANRNIDEGEIIMRVSAFASIECASCTGSQCFNCGTSENFAKIQCEYCSNVWFCSKKCTANRQHRNLCNPLYNNTDCFKKRLITEIINVATKNVTDFDVFFEFCCDILFGNKNPMSCQPPYSQYGVLLKLQGEREKSHQSVAKRVVSLVKYLPQFQSFGNKYNRILHTLAYQHAASLAMNVFSEQFPISKGGVLTRFTLYDIMSKFNHSCNPNVTHHIHEDNVVQCTTARRIKKGQQLFINYLGDDVQMTREERQFELKNTWDFKCKCSKCCEE